MGIPLYEAPHNVNWGFEGTGRWGVLALQTPWAQRRIDALIGTGGPPLVINNWTSYRASREYGGHATMIMRRNISSNGVFESHHEEMLSSTRCIHKKEDRAEAQNHARIQGERHVGRQHGTNKSHQGRLGEIF
jgi:phosphodiesterase/alkaline phosphatase D-like protein